MTWHELAWPEFLTDAVLADLGAAVDLDPAAVPPQVAVLAARILDVTGGLPYTEAGPLPEAERTRRARLLLHQAVLHVTRAGLPVPVPGSVAGPGTGYRPVRAVPRVAVNAAAAPELDGLPGVGPALAAAIVAERRRGPFRNVDDLADRVVGLGDATARALGSRLSFALPDQPVRAAPRGLVADLRELALARPGTDPGDRLVAALDLVAMRCAAERHPDAGHLQVRELSEPAAGATVRADAVVLLAGSQYHTRIRELIDGATRQVEVCMFHVALPEPGHPTAVLLDALAAATGRGVAVRVLADRDRAADPYLSTVVNAPALARLRASGAEVRTDREDRLLHSKVVLVDDDRTVIGSHNWTAGSYFLADDLSLLIESAPVCSAQRQRFETLWAAAG